MSLMRLGVLAVAMLAAGCLGPRTALTRYFLLAPLGAPAAEPSPATVGLGPVTLPDHLDQTGIAAPRGALEIGYVADARWAERLGPMLRRTLAGSLERRIGRPVVSYPWRPDAAPASVAEVSISRFDMGARSATLRAEWQVRAGGTLRSGVAEIDEPAGDTTVVERVAALNRSLARLSDQLAAALR